MLFDERAGWTMQFCFPFLTYQSIPGNRRKAGVKDMCVQWLNKWLGQFRQHIRSLAGKISRAQAGSVVKWVCSYVITPIWYTSEYIVINSKI